MAAKEWSYTYCSNVSCKSGCLKSQGIGNRTVCQPFVVKANSFNFHHLKPGMPYSLCFYDTAACTGDNIKHGDDDHCYDINFNRKGWRIISQGSC